MKTIMVVDDNVDLLMIIKRILDKEGFETIVAEDGDECLEKIRSLPRKPDLVLLDIMMPGTPVSEVVQQLGDVKVIYLSAVTISEKNREHLSSWKNVVDFIAKPFETTELIQIIKKTVGE